MRVRTAVAGVAIALLLGTSAVAGAQAAAAGMPPPVGGLPETIPLFPLPDPMLFPNASHSYRVFEPRYRTMVADALKGNRIIGMVALQPGHEDESEGRPPIEPLGCAGVITEYQQLPSGEYRIVLGGLIKFRVTSEEGGRAYRVAHVEPVPEIFTAREATDLMAERERLEGLLWALSRQLDVGHPPPGVPDEQVVDELSQFLPIDAGSRQYLLEKDGPLARARALVAMLDALRQKNQ